MVFRNAPAIAVFKSSFLLTYFYKIYGHTIIVFKSIIYHYHFIILHHSIYFICFILVRKLFNNFTSFHIFNLFY